MTELEHLSEHVDSNAEALSRLITIIGIAFPHLSYDLSALSKEWNKVAKEINDEYTKEQP